MIGEFQLVAEEPEVLRLAVSGPPSSAGAWSAVTLAKATGRASSIAPLDLAGESAPIPSDRGLWRLLQEEGGAHREAREFDPQSGQVIRRVPVADFAQVDSVLIAGNALWLTPGWDREADPEAGYPLIQRQALDSGVVSRLQAFGCLSHVLRGRDVAPNNI